MTPGPPRTILFVHHDAARYSGPERALENLTATLDRERWRSVVALPPGCPLWERLDGTTLCIPWRAYASPFRGPLLFARGVSQLTRAIRAVRPALVHANTYWSGRLATLAASLSAVPVPVIVHVRDSAFVVPPIDGTDPLPLGRAVRRALAAVTSLAIRPRATIAVSRFIALKLLALPVPPRRLAVIHDGVAPFHEPPAGSREALRARHGVAPDETLVGVVGRLHPQKGQDTAIDAVQALRARGLRVRLLIVGDATDASGRAYERALRERARAAGPGAVIFAGFLRDVAPAYAASDVLAVPSAELGGAAEAGANVAIEGLAAGRPVIISDSGGLVEFIRDGQDGLAFPPGDAAALARTLERLLADAPLRARLEAAGPVRAQEFSSERTARAVSALYEEVLGGG